MSRHLMPKLHYHVDSAYCYGHPIAMAGTPMSDPIPSALESSARLFFGFLLWGVSATLTFVLLVSLGDGTISSKVLLGIVAVALEGSKILAWRKGGPSRVYALVLIVLSAIASLGTSLVVVEKSSTSLLSVSAEALRSSPAYLAREAELASIDTEISTLVARIKSLPPDYTTATISTESYLSSLRDRKQGLIAMIEEDEDTAGASHEGGNIVVLLGRALGISPDTLLLVLLLLVSASIEVGALLLTMPDHRPRQVLNAPTRSSRHADVAGGASTTNPIFPPASYVPPITPEAFLEAATEGADLPFLHGRDKTAEKLGVSYADAKRLVRKLIEDGRVVVEGKRLRLAPVEATAPPTRTTL